MLATQPISQAPAYVQSAPGLGRGVNDDRRGGPLDAVGARERRRHGGAVFGEHRPDSLDPAVVQDAMKVLNVNPEKNNPAVS